MLVYQIMEFTYLLIFSVVTFLSAFMGGVFALKLKNRIYSIMALTAGIMLGAVSFEIFPEIFAQVAQGAALPIEIMIAFVIGFFAFHILEKTILIHHAHEGDYAKHDHPQVGILSALALITHCCIDGLSIGIGFKIDPALGAAIAIAVATHGFADGINSTTLMLVHGNTVSRSKKMLAATALAPTAGILLSLFVSFPIRTLVLYLGFFAGFILYIAASDILPEAHSKQSSLKLVGLTILGAVMMFFAGTLG